MDVHSERGGIVRDNMNNLEEVVRSIGDIT